MKKYLEEISKHIAADIRKAIDAKATVNARREAHIKYRPRGKAYAKVVTSHYSCKMNHLLSTVDRNSIY